MASRLIANRTGCYSAVPVVKESDLVAFLGGRRSANGAFMEVPPSVAIRQGFWLVFSRQVHKVAMAFLVDRRPTACVHDQQRRLHEIVLDWEGRCLLGRFEDWYFITHEDAEMLHMKRVKYVGQVVAAR
ncbi:hypothetical protein D3C85_1164180 [compost metagenome]